MQSILIVEDELDIANMLADDFRTDGYEAEIAGNGATALRRGKEVEWDLIILDLGLPGKDGLDVCRDLRRARVRTPIIMLTARSQEADMILGLELGADDYVTKPFRPRELRARVKAILRRFEDGDRRGVFRFGDVEVDFDRAEMRREKRVVDVTALEFKLLAAFIDRRGRALTRHQIMDAAWGSETFVVPRVVDSHIVNLRRKIEPKPRKPRYLMSVRGVGYRFDA